MTNTITKNAAYMTVASVGQKILSSLYFFLVANMIGVENTGKYFFVLSFTTIFVVFVDLGFTNVLVREAARTKERIQEYLSTVLGAKSIFGILSYIMLVAAVILLDYDQETRTMVYLSGVTMLFDSLHLALYGALRALGDLRYESGSIAASQLATLVLGSVFLWLGLPLIFLILAFTVPSFLNVLFAASILRRKHGIHLRPLYHLGTLRSFGLVAVPFALTAIFARVYSYIDSVLLSELAGTIAVGLYSIPYKMTYAFQFVPLALIAAVYPRFSEYFEHRREQLVELFIRSLRYLFFISFPVAIGIAILAEDIIRAVASPEYAPAVKPLQILIFSLLFSYASFPIGAFLNACNRQKTQMYIVGTVMVINIGLNILLIPRYSVVGASIAALIGNILLTVLGYGVIPQIAPIPHRQLFFAVLRIAAASIAMGALVSLANRYVHFTAAILVGMISYPVFLFATRGATRADLKEIRSLLYKQERVIEEPV